MLAVEKTDIFLSWLRSLREMRVDYGPGYRVYYAQRGKTLVVLLCGGDKRTQSSDIKMAKKLAKEFRHGT